MNLKQRIDADLKSALLGGDKILATTLRGLKSVILYAEVAKGSRENGLSDQEIVDLFTKEAKKREESAQLYAQGGDAVRQAAELTEKKVIEAYLPEQMPDEELVGVIDAVIRQTGANSVQQLGMVISEVKSRVNGTADGSRIAALTKERLA